MFLLILLILTFSYKLIFYIIGLPLLFATLLFTRALMPRYRINNLIYLNWKILIFTTIIAICTIMLLH